MLKNEVDWFNEDLQGKNTELHALLQRIFLTQVSKLDLLHCRQILYHRATKEAYKTS